MKYFLLAMAIILGESAFAQNGYYIENDGDTVQCEFKKAYPRGIKVKTEKDKNLSLGVDEIKEFVKDGIPFRVKRITNEKREKFASIFFPDDKVDRAYSYSDPNLVMISGKGVTFYELEEFGGVTQYGRSREITLYIENDSLGLIEVPTMRGIGGGPEKIDVINVLYKYLRHDEATEKKLNVNESWKTFNYKGVRKLIESFMGKELPG